MIKSMEAILRALAIPIGFLILRSVIDLNHPSIVLVLRLFASLGVTLQCIAFVFIFIKIGENSDGEKTIHVRPSQLVSPDFRGLATIEGSDDKTEMTVREYEYARLKDMFQRQMLINSVGIGMHLYFGISPVLLMLAYSAPRAIYQTEFFALYIQKKDPAIYRDLRRPWPDTKPTTVAAKFQDRYASWLKTYLDEEDGTTAKKKDKKKRLKTKSK